MNSKSLPSLIFIFLGAFIVSVWLASELTDTSEIDQAESGRYASQCEQYFDRIDKATTIEVLQKQITLAKNCLQRNKIAIPQEAQVYAENLESLLENKNLETGERIELIQKNTNRIDFILSTGTDYPDFLGLTFLCFIAVLFLILIVIK